MLAFVVGLGALAIGQDRPAIASKDVPSEAYFDRYWTRAEVDDLVEQIARSADVYKDWERARATQVKALAGYDDVNVWDLAFRPPARSPPRFTIAEASDVILAAAAPLGAEYRHELASLLDPANGRMDIVPGDHRRRGGFSRGFIGTDSVFYSQGFAGAYTDVRVLMHESTHAVHRQLMNRRQVLPLYATGPSFLFEAFAIFNELLLPDYLYAHDADPARKQYYLEQFLAGKSR